MVRSLRAAPASTLSLFCFAFDSSDSSLSRASFRSLALALLLVSSMFIAVVGAALIAHFAINLRSPIAFACSPVALAFPGGSPGSNLSSRLSVFFRSLVFAFFPHPFRILLRSLLRPRSLFLPSRACALVRASLVPPLALHLCCAWPLSPCCLRLFLRALSGLGFCANTIPTYSCVASLACLCFPPSFVLHTCAFCSPPCSLLG